MTYKSTHPLINFVRFEDLGTNEVASMMQHLSLEKFCPYSEDAKNGGGQFGRCLRNVTIKCREVLAGPFFDDRNICMARSFSCIHDGA